MKWLLLFLLLTCGRLPLTGQGEGFTLNIGLSRASFPDLNPKDVELSFRVLVEIIARKHGYSSRSVIHIFDRSQEFEAAMKRGEIQVAAVGSWEFSDMDITAAMEPAFVHVEQDKVGLDYVLLTRHEAGMNSLKDLRGKEALVLESSTCRLSTPWLDTLLWDEKLGTREAFFRKLEMVRKPSAAVLPVFFGKSQACVVDRLSFQVMMEMNPQVGRVLQVVATSPPLVSSILCVNRKGWPSDKYREDLVSVLRDLHLGPEGRQILMMFKVARLEPFREDQLGSLRELRAKHRRMGARTKS